MEFLKSISHWLVTTLEPYGGPGLMLIAIFDSSFLSLPEINDAALMALSISRPSSMWMLASMTVIGSVIGCTLLYSVGRKGGEAMLRKRFAADKVDRVRDWYKKYGMLAIIVPSLLPPPLPFKIFVLSAGAFHLPWLKFMMAVAIGRSIRYFSEGILAVWYGKQAVQIVADNFPIVGMVLAVLIVAGALVYVLMRRRKTTAAGLILLPLLMTLLGSGCVKKVNVPPKAPQFPFTRQQALQKLESVGEAIETFRAPITLEGSTASLKEANTRRLAPSLSGTLVMKRTGGIVLKAAKSVFSVFEIKSNGTNYQVYVDITNPKQLYVGVESSPPSKPFLHLDDLQNQFVNLRPKQLQDALMVDLRPLLRNPSIRTLMYRSPEEIDRKTYHIVEFLDVSSATEARIVQKIWFDLSTQNFDIVRRQTFTVGGDVETDTQYSGHQLLLGSVRYPSRVDFQIIDTDTLIRINVDPTQVALNAEVDEKIFELEPHPGATIYKFEPRDTGTTVTQQQ